MHVNIEKKELLQALQVNQEAISSKTSFPILANILIETINDNKLKLTTTDFELGIQYTINSEVKQPGSITVPCGRFVNIIKELPTNQITLQLKKTNIIQIEQQNIIFKILGISKQDFPEFPLLNQEQSLILPKKDVLNIIRKTIFSVSKEETRYVLNGVLLAVSNGQVTAVATDGRRLAIFTTNQIQNNSNVEMNAIIPTKTLALLSKLLSSYEKEEIMFCFSENQLMILLENIIIFSKLIDGEYPNYQQVIPAEMKQKIVVNKESLLNAVKRASILTTHEAMGVKFIIEKNKITIIKNTPEIGESYEEIETQYNGKQVTIGFNPSYLLDVLKNLEKETVEIEINTADKPVAIREDQYTYVALPMQLT